MFDSVTKVHLVGFLVVFKNVNVLSIKLNLILELGSHLFEIKLSLVSIYMIVTVARSLLANMLFKAGSILIKAGFSLTDFPHR